MARYMIHASYSTQGMSDLVNNPQDRAANLRPVIERMGGKMESFDYAFGDFDAVVIVDMPDNTAVASVAMAVGVSGAISSIKTTFIPMEEAYRPCGRQSAWDTGGQAADRASFSPQKTRRTQSFGILRSDPRAFGVLCGRFLSALERLCQAVSPAGSRASPV